MISKERRAAAMRAKRKYWKEHPELEPEWNKNRWKYAKRKKRDSDASIAYSMLEFCCYAYVFDDSFTYVGITRDIEVRHHAHRTERKSAVFQHHVKTGLSIPEPYVLYDRLTSKEAQVTEGIIADAIDRRILLNKAKTGPVSSSVGPIGTVKTAEERKLHRKTLRKEWRMKNKKRLMMRMRKYRAKDKNYSLKDAARYKRKRLAVLSMGWFMRRISKPLRVKLLTYDTTKGKDNEETDRT